MADIAAVALDFGGPVLLTPFERTRFLEGLYRLPHGSLDWRGPFDPERDPLWQELQAGGITEREYWHHRAQEVAEHTGGGTPRELFTAMFSDARAVVRPEAEAFVDLARARGLITSVFTNDLHDFQGPEWMATVPLLGGIDVIVDGSLTGVLKPDPRSYGLLVEAVNGVRAEGGLAPITPDQILYVDDQPFNIAGGEAAGLTCLWFDVTDAEGGYRRASLMLGEP